MEFQEKYHVEYQTRQNKTFCLVSLCLQTQETLLCLGVHFVKMTLLKFQIRLDYIFGGLMTLPYQQECLLLCDLQKGLCLGHYLHSLSPSHLYHLSH